MTKKQILIELLDVARILQMDYHEYIDHVLDDYGSDYLFDTDFCSLFNRQVEECLAKISGIFYFCGRESRSIGSFAFISGPRVVSDRVLSDSEREKLFRSSGRFMNFYGNKVFGTDWYLSDHDKRWLAVLSSPDRPKVCEVVPFREWVPPEVA